MIIILVSTCRWFCMLDSHSALFIGLCLHCLCGEPQDWESFNDASSSNRSSSSLPYPRQRPRLLYDDEIQKWSDFRHRQHYRKFWGRFPGSILLAARNRESTVDDSQRDASRRSCMVCYNFARLCSPFMTGIPLYRCAIPFTIATTLGLAAVALRNDPSMPVLTPADVTAGLVAPSVVSALLGKPGAIALLIVLFLAVTSSYYFPCLHITLSFISYRCLFSWADSCFEFDDLWCI